MNFFIPRKVCTLLYSVMACGRHIAELYIRSVLIPYPRELYQELELVYHNFEYVRVKGKLIPRKQGCAFLLRLMFWSELAYLVCQKKVRFFNTCKLEQKSFIDSLGVRTPKSLLVVSPSTIGSSDFEIPKCDFVLKPTNSFKSRGLFIKRGDTEIIRNKPFRFSSIQEEVQKLLHSRRVTSTYMFEELLVGEDGKCPPPLYKFFILGERIFKILYIGPYDGAKRQTDVACVDEAHSQIKLTWVSAIPSVNFDCRPPPKPLCWDEMLSAVKLVGKEMVIFTRVDFFAANSGATFGEFSFGWSQSDWTSQCSADLSTIYKSLPAAEKDCMIPNPFIPTASSKAQTVRKNPYKYKYVTKRNMTYIISLMLVAIVLLVYR